MGIKETGFLSREAKTLVKQNSQRLADYFEFCNKLNRYGQNVISNIKFHKYLHELVIGCLLARAMGDFQAVLLLGKRGMMIQTKAMLRCLIEVMFTIVAISKDNNYASVLVRTNNIEDKKALKTCIRNAKNFTKEEIEQSKRRVNEIESQNIDDNVNEITKRDIANKAGLEEYYDFAYKMLSRSLHVDLKILGNEHLSLDKTGELRSLKWGPNLKEMEMVLQTASDAIFKIFEGVFNVFGIEDRTKNQWIRKFDKLKYIHQGLYEIIPKNKQNNKLDSRLRGNDKV